MANIQKVLNFTAQTQCEALLESHWNYRSITVKVMTKFFLKLSWLANDLNQSFEEIRHINTCHIFTPIISYISDINKLLKNHEGRNRFISLTFSCICCSIIFRYLSPSPSSSISFNHSSRSLISRITRKQNEMEL